MGKVAATTSLPIEATANTRECPKCGHLVHVEPGYLSWCERCDWNVLASANVVPQNRFEKIYLKVGGKAHQFQLRRLANARSLQPSMTVGKLLAFALAAIVHSLVLIMFLEGCNLLIRENWQNLPMSVVGALLVGFAWAMRPRLGRVPTECIVDRSDCPALYGMVDQITQALGAKNIDVIYIESDFSAAFATVGLRRKNVLFLGIPLFSILTPEERVALIGHEVAHGVNGDSARGIIIGGAVSALVEWRSIFPLDGFLTLIILPVALIFVQLPKLLLYLLVHLLASDSQRAEYLADQMGARVGGTAGMLNLLHKLHMIEALTLSADRFFEGGRTQGVLEVLRKRVETIPPREIERIKRVENLLDSRLDSTHPPTRYRIELLEARPVNEPEVVLSPEHIAAIEEEVALITPYVEGWMLDSYKLRMGL